MEKRRKELVRAERIGRIMGFVFWWLGIVFAVLGVIGEVMNITLGLEPMSWLLLAIVASVVSIPHMIGWALFVYLDAILDAIEAKSKKEE